MSARIDEFQWYELPNVIILGYPHYRLETEQCCVDVVARPVYCDRARWETYVHDYGYPTNPSPFDLHDQPVRYFWFRQAAFVEMTTWLIKRDYTPAPRGTFRDGRAPGYLDTSFTDEELATAKHAEPSGEALKELMLTLL